MLQEEVRMKIWVLGCLLFSLFGLTACGKDEPKIDVSKRIINAVCTTGMITDIVQNVGGDRVKAVGLMGPGVDPHLYRATEGDVSKLSKADIIFYNGLHLEAKMGEIFEKMNGKKRTVAVSGSIPTKNLLSSAQFNGNYDPHIWFDVSLWMAAILVVKENLIKLDPTHADVYKSNAEKTLKTLGELHTEIKMSVQKIPKSQRVVVTAHDAFNYFGRAYGFEVIGLQGISTVAEAGTKDVQDLAKIIANRRIKAIFIESSVPIRNIQAVQEAVKSRGWDVKIGGELFSDAMGHAGSPEGNYPGMVRHNLKTIVNALK